MTSRPKYSGTRRKLVLAFDVGTTYSGISYSILDPGFVPEIKGVTKFPCHDTMEGSSKIPSILYYDRSGKVRAVGAEARPGRILEISLEEQWIKSEWFKLHLLTSTGGKNISADIPALPRNKTAVEVFADYLRYIYACAATFIQDNNLEGADLWKALKDDADIVLSHPNGWEGPQQGKMRQAAVLAGIIPDTTEGHERITFVTEGEASLHFAVHSGVLSRGLKPDDGVIIVDCGGGTIDLSAYKRTQDVKKPLEEIAVSQCHFQGAVFVSVNARKHLETFLKNSNYIDDIDAIIEAFDETTKIYFKSDADAQFIRFGSTKDNDFEHNIKFGQLKLDGKIIAEFFKPSIDCIVKAIKSQMKEAGRKIDHIVMVGGFSGNDWLLQKVKEGLKDVQINVARPVDPANKAASHGAVSFYLDNFVQARVTKFTYGCVLSTIYNENNPEHYKRRRMAVADREGDKLIPGSFVDFISKISQEEEYRESARRVLGSEDSEEFKSVGSFVWCYRGEGRCPDWIDEDIENFDILCRVNADLSHLPKTARTNSVGQTYWTVEFDIILLVGLTEMKAQIAWKEKRSAPFGGGYLACSHLEEHVTGRKMAKPREKVRNALLHNYDTATNLASKVTYMFSFI